MQNLKPCPFRQVDDEGHILCDKIKSGDREVSPNVCRACPVAAINCAHLRATLDHQTRPPITVRYGNGKTEVWEDDAPSISLHRAACAVKVTPILSPRDCAGCPLRQALIAPDPIAMPAAHYPVAAPAAPSDQPALAAQIPSTTPVTPAPVRRTATRPARPARTAPPAPAIAAAYAQVTSAPAAAAPAGTGPAPSSATTAEQQRSSIVAKKIIQLQEWLEKQKSAPAPIEPEMDDDIAPRRVAAAPMRPGVVAPPPPRLEEKRVGWTD